MSKDPLTRERLNSLLTYDDITGVFTWNEEGTGRKRKIAGNLSGSSGYLRIGIDGKVYYAHRLAYFAKTGEWPKSVDHRDGDRLNNAWLNLRNGTQEANAKNNSKRGCHQTNTGRWAAQITTNYKTKHLGTFDTEEEARAVYVAAKELLHPTWDRNASNTGHRVK